MTINQKRMQLFEADLRSAFELLDLKIEDESHLHAGHAGAASGGGHFKIRIVSPQFEGMNSVKRHRAIYAALSSHFPQAIHAMSPAEYTP
ncbi:MAG: BolA family transcriptional regulator [Polynucleobacter sp. 17-46-58]|nr:MAG: BolA family transcriptional regulator [Polynucleobacter sp. 17-46-58]